MEIKKVLLVKYGEISLRKGNRAYFEHVILDAIREKLKFNENLRVTREQGRFLIEDITGDVENVLPHIRKIFGITGFCHAIKTSACDIDELSEIGKNFFIEQIGEAKTFRVETKRSNKKYPMTSTEISAAIGGKIFTDCGFPVDLHNPEIILWVEIRNSIYFYVESEKGEGGLPYGSSGRGVLLLSGGFDSPVAGYLTARRGVEIIAVYFHSPPFVSERAVDKVRDLAQELAKYVRRIKLYIVPFTEIQLFLKDNLPMEKLTIFLKRAMLHTASKIAEKEKALCLITGDSIGQVASQTIPSLAAMDSAAKFPVIRPLAAFDKQSIIDMSQKIGTYDISIRPYEDCCTVFVAKHPENKPTKSVIEKMEAKVFSGLSPLLNEAFETAENIITE
jgi:thiamine biosynthesis protein ThiI